jgi:hypothetical protein
LAFLELLEKPMDHLPSAEVQLERKEAEKAAALGVWCMVCGGISCLHNIQQSVILRAFAWWVSQCDVMSTLPEVHL